MSPRVTEITTPETYPHDLSTEEQRAQLAKAFSAWAGFTRSDTWPDDFDQAPTVLANGWRQIFHVPRAAELLVELTSYVANELPWAQNLKLRELALLTLFLDQKCAYGYRAHLPPAADVGVTAEQLAELPMFSMSDAFDAEERDVMEFTRAAIAGPISDELFERLKERYGEQGVVELTVTVGFWTMIAVLLNVLEPAYDFPR
jgi:4-carboxymuconolactone decarboxylase